MMRSIETRRGSCFTIQRSRRVIYVIAITLQIAVISYLRFLVLSTICEEVSTETTAAKGNSNDDSSCLDTNGPQPYILMSLGRSGSTVLWQVIGNLTGYETKNYEYPGMDHDEVLSEFDLHQDGHWVDDELCKQQSRHPRAGVVGFKWKPYASTMKHPMFVLGLKRVSSLRDPPIKIIHSKRNPLDVVLSGAKHGDIGAKNILRETMEKDEKNQEKRIRSHCDLNDHKCIELHKKAGENLVLKPVELAKQLDSIAKSQDLLDEWLQNYGVRHVSVSYEKLFYSNNSAREWKRIFDFLGVKTITGITSKNVNQAMNLAATSNSHHNETIGNFEEVSTYLRTTQYKDLLH